MRSSVHSQQLSEVVWGAMQVFQSTIEVRFWRCSNGGLCKSILWVLVPRVCDSDRRMLKLLLPRKLLMLSFTGNCMLGLICLLSAE
jgi:hypothetical protein